MVQEVTHLVSQYVDVATAAPVSVHSGVSLRIVPLMLAVVVFGVVDCGWGVVRGVAGSMTENGGETSLSGPFWLNDIA
jgi:hypothetical protein